MRCVRMLTISMFSNEVQETYYFRLQFVGTSGVHRKGLWMGRKVSGVGCQVSEQAEIVARGGFAVGVARAARQNVVTLGVQRVLQRGFSSRDS